MNLLSSFGNAFFCHEVCFLPCQGLKLRDAKNLLGGSLCFLSFLAWSCTFIPFISWVTLVEGVIVGLHAQL